MWKLERRLSLVTAVKPSTWAGSPCPQALTRTGRRRHESTWYNDQCQGPTLNGGVSADGDDDAAQSDLLPRIGERGEFGDGSPRSNPALLTTQPS